MEINEFIIKNWEIQYIAAAENKELIAQMQELGNDLKNEMQELKDSVDEVNRKIEGGGRNNDQISHRNGNNFVSINFEGNYPNHEYV